MSTLSSLLTSIRRSVVLKLVAVNVVLFAALRVAALIAFFVVGDGAEELVCGWVSVPNSLTTLMWRPWTPLTYMFAQYGVLHLLFNMLWLYWFGKIFLEISSQRQLLGLYLYGGLMGALLFVVTYNLLPALSATTAWLIGASASVLAVVVATAMLMPEYPVGLLLFGQVKLKWLAIITIVIVLLNNPQAPAGGLVAHLGGILTGLLYAWARKRGVDITRPLAIFTPSRAPRRSRRPKHQRSSSSKASSKASSAPDTTELDAILDKLRQSGYNGLTDKEKKKLFEFSRKASS